MAGCFAVALALVLLTQTLTPPATRVGAELQSTARFSFALFWLATTGRALNALFGPRFHALARESRNLGLAFASAHTVHLALAAYLLHVEPQPFPILPLVFFSVGAAWLYLIVALSIPRIGALCKPKAVRLLRSFGVEYIGLIFLMDFAKNPFHGGVVHFILYAPFIVLALSGPLLRRAAALKRLRTSLAGLSDVTDYRGAV
jgi:hypothetical protein